LHFPGQGCNRILLKFRFPTNCCLYKERKKRTCVGISIKITILTRNQQCGLVVTALYAKVHILDFNIQLSLDRLGYVRLDHVN
jgi:hypothetical protein